MVCTLPLGIDNTKDVTSPYIDRVHLTPIEVSIFSNKISKHNGLARGKSTIKFRFFFGLTSITGQFAVSLPSEDPKQNYIFVSFNTAAVEEKYTLTQ